MTPYRPLPSIKVGPVTIPVVVNASLEDTHGRYLETPETRIEISGTAHDTAALTILHESLHAIDAMYALHLGERRVRVLENVLAALIADNPKLIAALR